MKKLILAMAVGIGALALTACQSTSNSPTPAAATGVCTNGVQVVNGTTIPCSTGTSGYGYGVPGYGVGTSGYGQAAGCSYWTQVYAAYGAYYVPMVDATSGQLECVNITQQNYSTLANYGYTGSSPLYYQNQYYNGAGYGGYGYGGGYGGGSGVCIGGGSDSFFGGICFQ